jgi:hypothetical protein
MYFSATQFYPTPLSETARNLFSSGLPNIKLKHPVALCRRQKASGLPSDQPTGCQNFIDTCIRLVYTYSKQEVLCVKCSSELFNSAGPLNTYKRLVGWVLKWRLHHDCLRSSVHMISPSALNGAQCLVYWSHLNYGRSIERVCNSNLFIQRI